MSTEFKKGMNFSDNFNAVHGRQAAMPPGIRVSQSFGGLGSFFPILHAPVSKCVCPAVAPSVVVFYPDSDNMEKIILEFLSKPDYYLVCDKQLRRLGGLMKHGQGIEMIDPGRRYGDLKTRRRGQNPSG